MILENFTSKLRFYPCCFCEEYVIIRAREGILCGWCDFLREFEGKKGFYAKEENSGPAFGGLSVFCRAVGMPER